MAALGVTASHEANSKGILHLIELCPCGMVRKQMMTCMYEEADIHVYKLSNFIGVQMRLIELISESCSLSAFCNS